MLTTNQQKNITISSKPENINKVVGELVVFFRGIRKPYEHAIALSLTEAVANAIVHGNKSDPTKRVFVKASTRPERLTIQVSDEGSGFNPHKLEDPTRKENLFKLGGRGIFFIRRYMDEVRINPSGNQITMVKYLT